MKIWIFLLYIELIEAKNEIVIVLKDNEENIQFINEGEMCMLKVMFICCAGMSTSLLVEKVNSEAEKQSVEMKVWAEGETEARKNFDEADVLLLGPQVRYLESGFKKLTEGTNVKVGVVDMLAYGRLDGKKVLDQILIMAD